MQHVLQFALHISIIFRGEKKCKLYIGEFTYGSSNAIWFNIDSQHKVAGYA